MQKTISTPASRSDCCYRLTGFEVTWVDRAEAALALAKESKFDFYLLDNWMPDMTGEALCRLLREFDPATPVLFYSGAEAQSDKVNAMAAGAQAYLVKPVDPALLVQTIRSLMRASPASA